jgi:hypothetical protein
MRSIVCEKTWQKFSNKALYKEFINTTSSQNRLERLKTILKVTDSSIIYENLISNEEFVMEYVIQPGLKGQVRGALLEKFLQTRIESYNLGMKGIICIPQMRSELNPTDERPDILLKDIYSFKEMIIFAQVDLDGGGAQQNRMNKYLSFEPQEDLKIVSFVADFREKSKNTDACKKNIKAIKNGTICGFKNLEHVILEFFRPEINL